MSNQPRWKRPFTSDPRFPAFPPHFPPGTPTQAPGPPRLPELPAQPYNPPLAPPVPAAPMASSGNQAEDYESALVTPKIGSSAAGIVSLYTTQKRWRGVDVWINTNGAIAQSVTQDKQLIVILFASVRGVRVPVATARYNALEDAELHQKHMIAYRSGVAERFEVAFALNFVPAAPTAVVQLAIMASDEAEATDDFADDEVGTTWQTGALAPAVHDTAPAPYSELRGITAVTALPVPAGGAVAAGRWLHVYDVATGDPLTDDQLIYAWQLNDGGGTFRPETAHRFLRGIRGIISTTAATTTPIGAEDSAVLAVGYR